MIDTIFWDLDGTLMDFHASERAALRAAFADFDYAISDENIAHYSAINDACWKQYERGEIADEDISRLRFERLLALLGLSFDVEALNDVYQHHLGRCFFFNDGALSLCQSLKGRFRQYIVTNGHTEVQHEKIRLSGLSAWMDGVFIAQEVGAPKPEAAFFDRCFAEIGEHHRAHTIIVGDSLTSDMAGGKAAGLICCWYNPLHLDAPSDLSVDAQIAALPELSDVLGRF